MESLLRTKVSRFELEDSLTLGEIEKKKQDGTLMEAIIPIDAMFPECRSVDVKRLEISICTTAIHFPFLL